MTGKWNTNKTIKILLISWNFYRDLIEEAKDKATELKLPDDRARALRRNSISLPSLNVNELEALRLGQQCHDGSVSVIDSGSDSLSGETTITPETPTTLPNFKPMLQFNDNSSSDEDNKPRSKTPAAIVVERV
uniref:Uncharacterized protein n=1 Tax=Anopheles maculatus TaxID=74869 RepID=A0A182TB31_9DIPT